MQFKLIFFDCDGVLTHDNVWDKFHHSIGLPKELENKWFHDYYERKLTFKRWNENLEEFYREKHLNQNNVINLFNRLTTNPEAVTIINFLHSKNILTAIISSGVVDYVQKYANLLDIKLWRANCWLEYDNDGNFKHIRYLDEDPKAKVIHIKEICQKQGIDPTETMFVGDSLNDIKAFKLTKHGVLYKSNNEQCIKYAWKRITNLAEIKDLINKL
jgi:HAD superfamily phosphoserine phosphatase-like hydrolase